MSPVDDTFLSGAVDDAVRLWDLRSPAAQGHLRVQGHPVVAYDPTGAVFAVALNERNVVLLYDVRKFDHSPFLTITIDDTAALSQVSMPPRVPVITHLSFNQSGQFILAGTAGDVHYVVDSFSGKVLWRLVGHLGLEQASGGGVGMVPQAGISGQEVCWTPDGKMVISGSANGQLCIWAMPEQIPTSPKTLQPSAMLNGHEGPARVVAFNPKCARTYYGSHRIVHGGCAGRTLAPGPRRSRRIASIAAAPHRTAACRSVARPSATCLHVARLALGLGIAGIRRGYTFRPCHSRSRRRSARRRATSLLSAWTLTRARASLCCTCLASRRRTTA